MHYYYALLCIGMHCYALLCIVTVSFYDFKSQNFKLSVSNPKSKYAAYLSVLSQISNCQSLGRKNKHDILKTDRMHCVIYVMSRVASRYYIPDMVNITY